jgi:hypothetical protein
MGTSSMSEYTVQGRLTNNFTYSSILHELLTISPKAYTTDSNYMHFCVKTVSYNLFLIIIVYLLTSAVFTHTVLGQTKGVQRLPTHLLKPDKYLHCKD